MYVYQKVKTFVYISPVVLTLRSGVHEAPHASVLFFFFSFPSNFVIEITLILTFIISKGPSTSYLKANVFYKIFLTLISSGS